jgi:hypothetical protein
MQSRAATPPAKTTQTVNLLQTNEVTEQRGLTADLERFVQ